MEYNNQIAFDIAEKELGIPPEMNGAEMAHCDVPDRLTLTSYLTKIYELLKVATLLHTHLPLLSTFLSSPPTFLYHTTVAFDTNRCYICYICYISSE